MLNVRIGKTIVISTEARGSVCSELTAAALRSRRHLVLIGCLLLLPAILGCEDGAADRIRMRKACLDHIFTGYAAFVQKHQVGPGDIEAFREFVDQIVPTEASEPQPMIAGQDVSDEAIARMKEGDIVVIWAANLPIENDEPAKYVVAFEAGVPGSGGYVVTADGEVQHVTAAKFSQFHELLP